MKEYNKPIEPFSNTSILYKENFSLLEEKLSKNIRTLLSNEEKFDWFTPEESKELLIARALKHILEDIVIYVNGVCYEYDGVVWRNHGSEHVFYLALKILFKELKKHKTKLLSNNNDTIDWQLELKIKKLSSLLYYTTSVRGNKLTLEAFKNNFPNKIKFSSDIFKIHESQDLISFRNFVINLKNLEQFHHSPKLYLTNIINCDLKPYDQTSNILDKFLMEIFDCNKEKAELVKMSLGYSITQSTHWKTAFLFTGPPNSGKSLLMHLLYETLSSNKDDSSYITSVQSTVFQSKTTSNSLDYTLRRFYKKRVVICSEFSSSMQPNIDLIKQIIGHDVITGRNPRERFLSFKSKIKLIFIANKIPALFDKNSELHEKISIIIFNKTLNEDGWWSRLYRNITKQDREEILSALIFYAHKSYSLNKPKTFDIFLRLKTGDSR